MKICKNEIAGYHSANFTEDEPLWDVNKAGGYQNGEEAREDHLIYKYAGISGTNTATSPSNNPLDWLVFKTSNYYAMLGDRTNDQTENAEEIIIEVDLNNYDTIALLNLDAVEARIEITDLSTMDVIFDETYDLNDTTEIVDALTYYFSPFTFKRSVYTNIPLFGNSRAKITISKPADVAKIGRLVVGQSYDIGSTLFDASFSLESYSVTTFDQFGTPTLTPREAVYNEAYDIRIPSQKLPQLKRKRKELDAIPILFIGDESDASEFENLLSYGLWQLADIVLTQPKFSLMSMTTKELL